MLREYIRGYAKNAQFDEEQIPDIVDNTDENGVFTFSVDNILSSLKEIDINEEKYVSFSIVLGSPKELLNQAIKLQDYLKNNVHSNNRFVISISKADGILYLFSLKKLENLKQKDFNAFLDEGGLIANCFLENKNIIHKYDWKALDENNQKVISFFNASDINLEDLNNSLGRIIIDDKVSILCNINYETLTLELESFIQESLLEDDLLNALSENAIFKGKACFNVVDDALFFKTFIDIKEENGNNLTSYINSHIKLVKEIQTQISTAKAKQTHESEWQYNANFLSV